jgi:NodT family efflux transporter outer membrane factor (OMF) lipoprotein
MTLFRASHLKLAVSFLALAATGCISTPPPAGLTPTDVPGQFETRAPADAQVWPNADWWQNFGSNELTELEKIGQTQNLDIVAAAARVLQAEAQYGVTRSQLFPNISLGASARRAGTPIGGTTIQTDSFGVSADASYQLDLFGQIRANVRASDETLRGSRYAQQTIALTTEAAIANGYLTVLALRERLTIEHKNVAAAERILAITQAKVTNGISSNLDLAQQRAQLEGEQAQIPIIEQLERQARYSLAVLLGRVPEGFNVTRQNLDGIAPPIVAPGLPSELLRRRPDVAQAEAALYSAHANVDAARAAFFPSFGLTGSGGVASNNIASLFSGGNFAWSIGIQLLQTIFDGGLLASESDFARARQTELVANYRASALNAFADVESSLGQTSSLAEQERLKTAQVADAQEAFRIAELQYREGVADLLLVLQTQQTLFNSQDQLVQIRLARLQSIVGLYQALGGGWVETQNGTPASPPVGPIQTNVNPEKPVGEN